MTKSKLVKYAVWFGSDELTDKQISRAFFEFWEETWKNWNLPPTAIDFEPWLRVGRGFYLLLAESHCSPGDICGYIKQNGLIGSSDEVVAVRLDNDWYIPHQGLTEPKAREKIYTWQEQSEKHCLVRRR